MKGVSQRKRDGAIYMYIVIQGASLDMHTKCLKSCRR